jgi:hypothetical protein
MAAQLIQAGRINARRDVAYLIACSSAQPLRLFIVSKPIVGWQGLMG